MTEMASAYFPSDICTSRDAGSAPSHGESIVVSAYAKGGAKRAFDLVVGSLILTVAFVPMALIAFLVKLDSGGPVLFRQHRVGLGGAVFPLLKFRSMRVQGSETFRQATRHDARVTRIGRLIRATSLDELPQLLNVMRGDMSLIGPRPHPAELDLIYGTRVADYAARWTVRPGLTGLAQISGARGETPTVDHMARRVGFDLQYIRAASLWMDLRILFGTAREVVASKSAF